MLPLFKLSEDYWESFELDPEDTEFLYHHLLEIETPLSPEELVTVLVEERVRREKLRAERQRSAVGDIYLPKEKYKVGQTLVMPAMQWQTGSVTAVRPGRGYTGEKFDVIEVEFEEGEKHEFASGLETHALNNPPEVEEEDPSLNPETIIETFGNALEERLITGLSKNDDFVYIAGRWFPQALLVDVNVGNLNLAEAVLEVNGGGPMATEDIISQVELPEGVNPKLVEFSLDLALQEDPRFDEVGPAGKVAWFLKRYEPEEVQDTPLMLQYHPIDHDRSVLTKEMLTFEERMDDELSPLPPLTGKAAKGDEVEVRLIYPHWRVGSLPLTPRISQLFPTAYETPRIRFILVDGETGERFPGWVVRLEKYVYGLREWYESHGSMPGSYVTVRRGEKPGEVIVKADSHRSSKEWVRTALVGADGGVVYAMLKQTVSTSFDQRMVVAMPSEIEPLDMAWERRAKRPPAFEQVVVDTMRELAKLNPQSHVHASELYSAINVVMRCPPAPILALLASRPWFEHVGDLHFRVEDVQAQEQGS